MTIKEFKDFFLKNYCQQMGFAKEIYNGLQQNYQKALILVMLRNLIIHF